MNLNVVHLEVFGKSAQGEMFFDDMQTRNYMKGEVTHIRFETND